jgi:hypothetical protein
VQVLGDVVAAVAVAVAVVLDAVPDAEDGLAEVVEVVEAAVEELEW